MDPNQPHAPVRLDALNEQDGTATTTSPTGTPKVPVDVVPWLQAGMAGVAATAGAYVLYGHNEQLKFLCVLFAAFYGGITGQASAGNRKKDGAQ